MLCPYCGASNRDAAAFCLGCRRTLGPAPPPAPAYQGLEAPAVDRWQTPYYDRAPVAPGTFMYAAFWPRFGAWLLDFLFASLFAAGPGIALTIAFVLQVDTSGSEGEDNTSLAIVGGFMLGYLPVYLAYKTIANAKGGGWGKRIAGLRVLRERDGANPGYGTGFLRAFVSAALGSFVSILWLLDKLWCIWDRQKQTWHDKIAGTVVVAVR